MNAPDVTLPELSDERIGEIEVELFARLAADRRDALADADRARVRAVRRGRVWMGAAAAAAVVAVAAIIAPQLSSVGVGSAGSAAPAVDGTWRDQAAPDVAGGGTLGESAQEVTSGADSAAPDGATREVIATASATVRVDDTDAAAKALAETAAAAGGYVESMSIGSDSSPVDVGASEGGTDVVGPSYPGPSGAWVTIRVPADQLTATLAGLSELGTIVSTQVDRSDITTQAVDLRARVSALEASVQRLTELVSQSTTTADLIAAESALADRQSELESLRQQLTYLDDQVAMSTLTVNLTEPAPIAQARPAGFGDGLAAGWSGLVASLNGVVIALGFLLPWLAVAAIVFGGVWGVRRAVRARSDRADAAGE
ncbi:MAG: DUF4349 domain-containing protein [Microbacterium sp.]|nr:MAG: DUF4349 domain-containing protein [Microbacterium sp.]